MTRCSATMVQLVFALVFVAMSSVTALGAADYVRDFEFIERTVAARGASVTSKNIDWARVCSRYRPEFAACTSDFEHVKNVMRLLAELRDSHTGVTRSSVDQKSLPSKFDGLFGGGLWIGWHEGRFLVQGIMPRHALAEKIPLGSDIISIDGVPAWIAMEQEWHRMAVYSGQSSRHSTFASLGNRILPFGDKQQITVELLTPKGDRVTVKVPRWGPGGQAFSMRAATMPAGVESAPGAVAKLLSFPWSSKVGYLRITGSMNGTTVTAFHRAFDTLRGMELLILDCRAMGGGSDSSAWEMAGRLFRKSTPNGNQRNIEPSGSWQFDGPVVMLQDELEVSSAETFTWAVSETERVVSVGRRTGGWGIIPNGFQCPSGLVDFRLGVNNRATPIRRIHTEGVGWPADVEIPYGPVICSVGDPTMEFGLAAAQLLRAGMSAGDTRSSLSQLMNGQRSRFEKAAKAIRKKAKSLDPGALAKRVVDDIVADLEQEMRLLDPKLTALPDYQGATVRIAKLAPRAKAAGLSKPAKKLEKSISRAKKEAAAQADLRPLLNPISPPDDKAKRAFLKKHKKTQTAHWVSTHLWR